MTQQISSKNTKAEIIQAYEKLQKELEAKKDDAPKKIQEQKQKQETVSKVADVSYQGIVNGIASLKLNLTGALDKLESNLVDEFKKLDDIRNAIAIEKQNLEDLYGITTNADSLAVMLQVQKQKREDFDTEMAEKKEALDLEIKTKKETFDAEQKQLQELWKDQKTKHQEEEKEYVEDLKKIRKREEDEYQYTLKITRQKEKDAYETKKAKLENDLAEQKAAFEKEVTERETKVAEAENELAELRKSNAEFPQQLEKALNAKEKEVSQRMEAQFDFERKLTAKQFDGDLKLKEQTVASLTEKIAEMQAQIKDLASKAGVAEANVKDIAVKAIESSTKMQVISKEINRKEE